MPTRSVTERTSTWKWIPALAVVVCGGWLCVTNPAHGAGLLVANDGFGGVLKIKEHDVHVTINNGVAVTEVEQVFVNTEPRIVEALYTFPVPARASVSNFSMWINGQEMVGEVVEKQRARQIYNSYKQVKRDPGLLEQVDYKRFEMRIFPIPPNGEQRVKITYYQELNFDHDAATYVYPLATVTQGKADERTTGRFAFALDAKSAVPFVNVESPSHSDQVAVVKHADNHYVQTSLETKAGDLSRDVVVHLQVARPTTGLDFIASKQSSEDGYLLFTLTAGKELEDKLTGSDYVFVLDISGSMSFDNKLTLSRSTVGAFLQTLSDDDRFEVMTFNIGQQALFHNLQPGSTTNKQQAEEFLRNQRAQGGTVLRPAMEGAYKYRQNDRRLNVVILSDGMTELQETAGLLDLIKNRPSNVAVFCVGVGNEVNRPLLTQLAEGAGGLAAFLSNGDDFQRQAEAFRRKLTRPAATNVKLSFSGDNVYAAEPEMLPNLFHGQPLRLYARYRQAGPVKVRIQAEILGSLLDQTVEVNLPANEPSNPHIERMWAAHRVERLIRDAREQNTQPAAAEIVRLSEGYSIANEYASFIVLENDAEYRRWSIERRNAVRQKRDAASLADVRQQFEKLRQATAEKLGPAPAAEPTTTKPVAANSPQPTFDVSPLPSNSSTPTSTPNVGPIDSSPRTNSPAHSSGGGGGGAIDPLTALVALGLAGLGWQNRRRSAA